jgi:hypothetical protein
MRGYSRRESICSALSLLSLAACAQAPTALPTAGQYLRIGVLPAYEPELAKRSPPSLFSGEVVERLDLDFGLNKLVVDRLTKSLGQGREVVDLQSYAAAYIGTPKVHSAGERKIFGDSRPLFTEVVKSVVGGQGLDAYVVIEGGPVRLYEPQVAPALQMLKAQGHDLSMLLNIFVIDSRTFEIAAASRTNLVQKGVADSWFVAPRQHTDAIKDTLMNLVDRDLEPSLRKLGLI